MRRRRTLSWSCTRDSTRSSQCQQPPTTSPMWTASAHISRFLNMWSGSWWICSCSTYRWRRKTSPFHRAEYPTDQRCMKTVASSLQRTPLSWSAVMEHRVCWLHSTLRRCAHIWNAACSNKNWLHSRRRTRQRQKVINVAVDEQGVDVLL